MNNDIGMRVVGEICILNHKAKLWRAFTRCSAMASFLMMDVEGELLTKLKNVQEAARYIKASHKLYKNIRESQ